MYHHDYLTNEIKSKITIPPEMNYYLIMSFNQITRKSIRITKKKQMTVAPHNSKNDNKRLHSKSERNVIKKKGTYAKVSIANCHKRTH